MIVRSSKGGAARRKRIVRRTEMTVLASQLYMTPPPPLQTSMMTMYYLVLPYSKYDLSLRVEIPFQNRIGVHGEPVFLVTKLGTTETVLVPGISDLFISSQ